MRTHLPKELIEAIEQVAAEDEYSVYVLDGQQAERTGDGDDWHDALILIEPDHVDNGSPSRLVKFTMSPDGQIVYYHPLGNDAETVVRQPDKES